ncbi:unnamed protein product [Dibothriocephalus latus]|uniref:Uncharacterized protein n=1 Tax=Dibothriocephalus latus TaxID=60516 RepID=A0A3P7M3P7_DIBLA|nr:unnamed protein product [Dibothriocephalus latus]
MAKLGPGVTDGDVVVKMFGLLAKLPDAVLLSTELEGSDVAATASAVPGDAVVDEGIPASGKSVDLTLAVGPSVSAVPEGLGWDVVDTVSVTVLGGDVDATVSAVPGGAAVDEDIPASGKSVDLKLGVGP